MYIVFSSSLSTYYYKMSRNNTRGNSATRIIDPRTRTNFLPTVKDAAEGENSASDSTEGSATSEDSADESFDDSNSCYTTGSDIVGSDDSGAEQLQRTILSEPDSCQLQDIVNYVDVLHIKIHHLAKGLLQRPADQSSVKERFPLGAKLLEGTFWDIWEDPSSLDEKILSNELFDKDEKVTLVLQNRSGGKRFERPVNGNRTKDVLTTIYKFYDEYLRTKSEDNGYTEGHYEEDTDEQGFNSMVDNGFFTGIEYQTQGKWLVNVE